MSERKPGRTPRSVKLVVEHLEARCLLTTYYSLTFLGGFGGDSAAYAVNSSGQVVGQSYDLFGAERAYIWDSTNGLQNLAPGIVAAAMGINDSGQVAGGEGDAVIWDTAHGTTQHLGTLGGMNSDGASINSRGYVVGFSDTGGSTNRAHAFLWDPTIQLMSDLGTLGGDLVSYAYGINNDHKEVVGISESGGEVGSYHAFLWTRRTGMVNLVPGSNNSGAYAINYSGQVVGFADGRAFLWTPDVPNGTTGAISYLDDCNPSGPRAFTAYGINDNAQVVGQLVGGHGFVWDSTNCTQIITDLVMPATNFSLTDAYGINNSGQIVGFGGYLPNGPGGSVLFTPIPGAAGKGLRPACLTISEIGRVLDSLSRAHSPTDLDSFFSFHHRADVGQSPLSQHVLGGDQGVPPQTSVPLRLTHHDQAKDSGVLQQDGSENPVDPSATGKVASLQ